MSLAIDVVLFDLQRKLRLKESIKHLCVCYKPTCYVKIQITGGSVGVSTQLIVPMGGGSTPTNAATSAGAAVQAAANNLVTQPTTVLSASLGEPVSQVAPSVGVEVGVTVPLVISPVTPRMPPPEPPQTPPPTPPSPFAPLPSYATSTSTASSVASASTAASADSEMPVMILAAVIGGLSSIIILLVYCYMSRQVGGAQKAQQRGRHHADNEHALELAEIDTASSMPLPPPIGPGPNSLPAPSSTAGIMPLPPPSNAEGTMPLPPPARLGSRTNGQRPNSPARLGSRLRIVDEYQEDAFPEAEYSGRLSSLRGLRGNAGVDA